MIQDLVIIGGTGNVGKTLVNTILGTEGVNPVDRRSPVRIMGIASSTHFLYSGAGLEKLEIGRFLQRDFSYAQPISDIGEIVDEVRKNYRENSSRMVFVDATAVNEPMTRAHLAIHAQHYGMATANKNPIALSHPAVFQELTEDPSLYGYRCSVMAGADVVPFLRDAKYQGINLRSIEGCFSGTLGYICSGLDEGRKFSEILKDARANKYTEPDPRDDLNGLDVARKMISLARTAGYNVELSDIALEPFIPQKYFVKGEGVEAFMEKSRELDGFFEQKMIEARERGMTLRYVGRMDVNNGTASIKVSLQEVPKESDLGALRGTANQIILFNEIYDTAPHVIKAPGAGLLITASNVARDLLYLPGGMLHQNTMR